jgi:hypothetical protein
MKIYKCDDSPDYGSYACDDCNTEILINDDCTTLPPCPSCDCCTWVTVEKVEE